MLKYIVVETDEEEQLLVEAGLDRLAEIVVSGYDSGPGLASSIALSRIETTNVVFVIGTLSEEDRFFNSWKENADFIAERAINDNRSSILPAAPSIEVACKNPAWVERLAVRLNEDRAL